MQASDRGVLESVSQSLLGLLGLVAEKLLRAAVTATREAGLTDQACRVQDKGSDVISQMNQ